MVHQGPIQSPHSRVELLRGWSEVAKLNSTRLSLAEVDIGFWRAGRCSERTKLVRPNQPTNQHRAETLQCFSTLRTVDSTSLTSIALTGSSLSTRNLFLFFWFPCWTHPYTRANSIRRPLLSSSSLSRTATASDMAQEQPAEAPSQPPAAEVPELDESLQPFDINLYLPKRPLIPSAAASQNGLPETPSPLKVAVTPQETLNDLRVTITDSPEGYWLGAFCFRKPQPGAAPTAKGAKVALGERVSEWTELREVFQDVPKDQRELYVTHVPFNEADARAHVQRLRDLLSGGAADPSAIGVDAALSVQDAVRNPEEWQHDSSRQNANGRNASKKGADATAEAASTESQLPFIDWAGWPAVTAIDLIPAVARRPRQLPLCLRQLSLASWNPPPQHCKLNGHLLYLQVGTLEGEVIFITASTHGFYVNKSSGARFDPSPRASGQDFASCSLFDLLCGFSPLFLASFARLFNDPLSSRDYFSAVPVTNSLPAIPWLARQHPHNPDPLRSQAAFLLTGASSADTLEGTRDWNDELQSARELPRTTLPERLMRDRVLNRIYSEFTQAAARAIPKVAAGEVQAMNPMDKRDAQMFIVNNLFISKGADGVDLYPHMGGDEAAHVAVGKDIQGVKTLNSLDVSGLCLLGTIVVDWKGERWVAQSVVPGLFRRRDDADAELEDGDANKAQETEAAKEEPKAENPTDDKAAAAKSPRGDLNDDTQVVYGGVEGPEVIRDNAAFHKLFRQVAQTLHLSEHDVEDANGRTHPLWLSVDSKGLRGADGRRYVLDLACLNPVDINWLEKDIAGAIHGSESSSSSDDKARYPHRMTLLRPELLEIYWDSEFRKWARAKLAERQEAKAAKASEAKAVEGKEDAKEEGADADKAEAEAEEEPERLDSSEFKLTFNPDAFVEFKVADPSVEDGSKLTPESLKQKLVEEIRKRYRFELPLSFFDQELRRPQLLREVALRAGVQLKLQNYVLEGKLVEADGALSDDSHGEVQANGNAKENGAGVSGKKNKNKKKGSNGELNGSKKTAGSADKKPIQAARTTSFEPSDVLNLVPVVKDSTPKSTLAEEAFDAGRLSISRGDRDLGLELLLEGVSFHEQVYGLVHPEVARCYALFATIVHHLAGVAAMERAEILNQAKAENKEVSEADLPAVNEQVSMANAVRYQRQAVTVSERTLGLDHPETLNQYMNLAVLERSAGNTRESLLCQRRVLELWSLLYGQEHPDCINVLSNVALTLQNAKLFEASLRVYESAHQLALRLFGADSIHTANLAHELSQAHTLVGDLKTALTVEKEAWRVFEARLGKEDAQTKESETFCLNLAASAVRVAKLEKEASAREARQGAFGLPNARRVGANATANGAATTGAIAGAAPGGAPANANKSLDEIVRFIQGGSSTPSSTKGKSKGKGKAGRR
ncbi:hypothetical protein L1887_59944 [Cichorium endivia]|nr:hypothetical protein L1887_59944 [Cichorium endivia]